jgi:hypothetical protein
MPKHVAQPGKWTFRLNPKKIHTQPDPEEKASHQNTSVTILKQQQNAEHFSKNYFFLDTCDIKLLLHCEQSSSAPFFIAPHTYLHPPHTSSEHNPEVYTFPRDRLEQSPLCSQSVK